MEKQLLDPVLHTTNWKREQAARELNISVSDEILVYQLKQSGLADLRVRGKGSLSQ